MEPYEKKLLNTKKILPHIWWEGRLRLSNYWPQAEMDSFSEMSGSQISELSQHKKSLGRFSANDINDL